MIVVGVLQALVVIVVRSTAEVQPLGCTNGVVSAVAMTVVDMAAITGSRERRAIFMGVFAAALNPGARSWRDSVLLLDE